MGHVAILLSILLTIAATVGIGAAAGEDVTERLDRYRHDQRLHNAVSIRASDDTGWRAEGFGLIFGRARDVVWIATAAHVVFPKYTGVAFLGLAPASRIEVRRRDDTRTWLVTRLPEMTGVPDLALLPVDMPLREIGGDRWVEPSIDTDPRPGDSIYIAGYQKTIEYFSNHAIIASIDAMHIPEITDLGGGRGQSGAAVATGRGFIGLYNKSAGQRFIPIRQIQQAALDAHRPWHLTDVQPRAKPTRLCLIVRGVALETIQVAGPSRLTSLDASGCAETHSGLNKFSSTAPWVVCTPDHVELPAGSTEQVQVDCVVSVAGIWSGDDGFAEITSKGNNEWKIEEGLHRSPYGWIVGKLTGTPPSLSLSGRTQSGLSINGQVRVEGRRLSGRIFVGGAAWQLELSR